MNTLYTNYLVIACMHEYIVHELVTKMGWPMCMHEYIVYELVIKIELPMCMHEYIVYELPGDMNT